MCIRIRPSEVLFLLATQACVLACAGATLSLTDIDPTAVRRIAVLPFSGTDSYPHVTADWIAFRLGETGRFDVASAERSGILLRDAGLSWPPEGEPPPDVVRGVAAALHADVLVSGTTVRTGASMSQWRPFRVDLRVWEGPTGRLAGQTSVETGFLAAMSDFSVMSHTAERAATCVVEALGGRPPTGGD